MLVDQERCRGYQECMTACPYKKTMFNLETHVSEKCIGCYPKIEQGLQTQCIDLCIGHLRLTASSTRPDRPTGATRPTSSSTCGRSPCRSIPQFGLEPNVYYIPPVHVPVEYLGQMFGPGVERAIATYKGREGRRRAARAASCCSAATERIIDTLRRGDGDRPWLRPRQGRGARRACLSASPTFGAQATPMRPS